MMKGCWREVEHTEEKEEEKEGKKVVPYFMN